MRHEKSPMLLKPSGKDYLWGGSRLNDDYSKNINMNSLAETWECSAHPDGLSIVRSGPFSGQTLRDVLLAHPEYVGERVIRNHKLKPGELPVIVKLIDAEKKLSVQVHPDDAYAICHENGQRGKSELWYVLDAVPGAQLVYGFYESVDPYTLRCSILDGTVEKYLQKVPVKAGDVFFIPAGTVHAIGAGILLAEIQDSSNLTYRLYDYDRQDRNGQKRLLHIDKALAVANLRSSAAPKQPLRKLSYHRGCAEENLCRTGTFSVQHLIINTERIREMYQIESEEDNYMILQCIQGCGMIRVMEDVLSVFQGDCVFVPAGCSGIRVHGKMEMLKIYS